MSKYFSPFILPVLYFVCAPIAQSQLRFPDVLAGWHRNDSTTVLESHLQAKLANEASVLLEYGFSRMQQAEYALGTERIRMRCFEMQSMLAAFGYFSLQCGRERFNGSVGNAAIHQSNTTLMNYGNYYVVVSKSGKEESQPPSEFMNAVYDLLATVAVYELITAPYPLDEIENGSERYYAGRESWKLFTDSTFHPIMSIIDSVKGYDVVYAKPRMNITRASILTEIKNESMRDFLHQACVDSLKSIGKQKRERSGVTELHVGDRKYFVAKYGRNLFVVVTDDGDSGAWDWVLDEVKKMK